MTQVDLEEAIERTEKSRGAELLEINSTYGDNLPYQRERVINETRFYMSQSAEAMLEAGKRLVMIKETEPHGEFIKILEDDLKINARTARAMMQASIKFLKLGESKRQTFADLGKSKIFELVTLDNDDLEELAEGGTVAGLTLDELDKMSVRELKAALKEARQSVEDKERLISDKDHKINDLDSKITRLEKKKKKEIELTPDDVVAAYKDKWNEIDKGFCARVVDIKTLMNQALDEDLPHHFYQQIAVSVAEARNTLNDLLTVLPGDNDVTADIDYMAPIPGIDEE